MIVILQMRRMFISRCSKNDIKITIEIFDNFQPLKFDNPTFNNFDDII